ncbi:MAG: hypothetical protein ACREC5_06175, partial [Thermoplasmata archaeon]
SAPGVFEVNLSVSDFGGEVQRLGPLRFDVAPAPSVGVPSVSRTTLDANQSLSFRAIPSGGSGGLAYRWIGLPAACQFTDTAEPVCDPQVAGPIFAQVVVTDQNGVTSSPSPSTSVAVSADPRVVTLVLTPTVVDAGAPWTATLEVEGGLGPYVVNWSGLPPGCSSGSVAVSCSPTVAGRYVPLVNVTDSNGYSVYFGGSGTVTVLPPPPPVPTGFFSELPPGWEYLLAGAAGVVGIAVASVIFYRMVGRHPVRRPTARRPV